MDSEDEAVPYLKFFNENPGSYLLQNAYEVQDTLPVESLFTEIDSGPWPSESFSILLNGSTITDNNVNTPEEGSSEAIEGYNLKDKNPSYNVDFPKKNSDKFLSEDAIVSPENTPCVVIPQDSILQIENPNDDKLGLSKKSILLYANGTTYAITYSSNKATDFSEKNDNKTIILNGANNLIETNKHITDANNKLDHVLLPSVEKNIKSRGTNAVILRNHQLDESDKLNNLKDFYTVLTVRKCKICSFICEGVIEILDHLNKIHADLVKLKQAIDKENSKLSNQVKMTSILNTRTVEENRIENSSILFICSHCSKIFQDKEILMDHVSQVHNETVNSEIITNPEYSENNNDQSGSTSMPIDHNELANTEQPFNDDEIKKHKSKLIMRTFANTLLKAQKKTMKKVKCSVKGCSLKLGCEESRIRHEECHIPNRKQFLCPVCKEKFSLWRICSRHLWTCHRIDAGLYTCPLCNNYKSNSPISVANHMDIHNYDSPFVCGDCGKSFKQQTQLNNHSMIHKNKDELPPWCTSRKCTICGRYLSDTKSLKKHIQSVHDKLKPYICNICGHKTARKATLKLHLRQHTGDKPHNCSHCTYKTADHNCLRRHVMKHYGSNQYSCPYCKYKSIQSSSYKKHLETKHPEAGDTFKCNYCKFTTLSHGTYLTHVKCHEVAEKDDNRDTENSHEDNEHIVDDEYNNSTPRKKNEDDYDNHIYLHLTDNGDHAEEIIDTGGITIPAGFEMQLAQ